MLEASIEVSDAASGQVVASGRAKAWSCAGFWGRGRNWSRGGSEARATLGHGARWDVGTMGQGLGRGNGEIMCS